MPKCFTDMIAIEVRPVDMFEDVCSKVGDEPIFLPVGVVTSVEVALS